MLLFQSEEYMKVRWTNSTCITIQDNFFMCLICSDFGKPSLYTIITIHVCDIVTDSICMLEPCFDFDLSSSHHYGQYIITSDHYIAVADCSVDLCETRGFSFVVLFVHFSYSFLAEI